MWTPSAPATQFKGCAMAHLHGFGGDEGEVCHEDVEADDSPHGPHQALPGVLGDVLRDVRVVRHLHFKFRFETELEF